MNLEDIKTSRLTDSEYISMILHNSIKKSYDNMIHYYYNDQCILKYAIINPVDIIVNEYFLVECREMGCNILQILASLRTEIGITLISCYSNQLKKNFQTE